MTSSPSERTPRSTVLVVDDEPSICWAFERMLADEGHRVITASSAEEGLQIARDQPLDLILLDVRLPKEDGISALPKFTRLRQRCPVVVMTAFGDLETAVSAVKSGAYEYLIKPFRLDEARRICKTALSKSRMTETETDGEVRSTATAEDRKRLVGQSAAMGRVFRQIALIAPSDISVLITGETGTGKELVAAAIHRHSHRAGAPYLPIAPVALNEDLVESELFGHVKGAFTGADSDRVGLFERAEGGTVLLDEIGDLPMNIQVKLLRILEQGEYSRVGDVTPRRCNVRILAATNCDLTEAIAAGRFREDLFFRLSGLQIHLPPLRQRTDDIGPLCEHFLTLMGQERLAKTVGDSLLDLLAQRNWRGNVRELRNAIEHAAVVARGRALTIEDFPPEQFSGASAAGDPGSTLQAAVSEWVQARLAGDAVESLHGALIAVIEPPLLRAALRQTSNNRAAAAELLGIHRGTLREKLKAYEIGDQPDAG